MKKYMLFAKFSETYYEGMVSNPHDRKEAIYKLFDAANMKVVSEESIIYTEHPDFDFVCVVWAENEETCKALQAMMVATGKVKKVLFTRAWSSQDWQDISKKASSLVGTYVAPADDKKD